MDGDHIDHIIKRGFVQTTNATPTTLVSIDLSDHTATDSIIAAHGWAQGMTSNFADGYAKEVSAGGSINENNFGISSSDIIDMGNVVDGAVVFDVNISGSSNTVTLVVTGEAATTVNWHGRLTVEITEADLQISID